MIDFKKEHLILAVVAILIFGLGFSSLFRKNKPVPIIIKEVSTSQSERKIVVHLAGAVKKGGLYELKGNVRIADVIALAGGVLPLADLNRVNLAQKIADGQKILIPFKRKQLKNSSSSFTESSGQKININTATVTELQKISGIGPSFAKRIIKYREKNGYFNELNDLLKVSGIGKKKLEALKDEIIL